MAPWNGSAGQSETSQQAARAVVAIVVLAGMLFGVSGVIRAGETDLTAYCNCDYAIDCGELEWCNTDTGCPSPPPPSSPYIGRCVRIAK